jgi:hypothetical protein
MLPCTEKVANLARSGALIPMRLGVLEPSPIQALGMIDTGAGFILIHTDLVNSLGLTPTGTTRLITVTQEAFECPEYRIRLQPIGKTKIRSGTSYEYEAWKYHIRIAFIDFKRSFEFIAVEIPNIIRPRLRIQCLFGLDILQHFIMTYDGLNDVHSLTYKGPADAG